MLANLGWGEVLVLIVAGLIILGPERLPGAISSGFSLLRKANGYISSVAADLREEMGEEFDEFREPLWQLSELRSTTPHSLISQHIYRGESMMYPRNCSDSSFKWSNRIGSSKRQDFASEDGSAGTATSHNVADWDAT